MLDAAHGPRDAAVELPEIRVLRQRGRKLDVLHQLGWALALLHPLDRLVENGLDGIAVRRERGARSAAAQNGAIWPRAEEADPRSLGRSACIGVKLDFRTLWLRMHGQRRENPGELATSGTVWRQPPRASSEPQNQTPCCSRERCTGELPE